MKRKADAPHVWLGTVAALLAIAALVVDVFGPMAGGRDAASVTPIELARWIRDARPDLDLIDLRDSADFDEGHIPGARNAPLAGFDGAPASAGARVVVYAEADEDAAAGAARVDATGLAAAVFVLERGLDGWLDDVMAPRIGHDATESERAAFADRSELSRWFGGIPRIVDTSEEPPTAGHSRSKRLLAGC